MMRAAVFARPVVVLALALAGAAACSSDPIHDGAVQQQGKEVTGVPIGQYHRAGQACTVCHEDHGPASGSVFSVAGTIFDGPGTYIGVDNASVEMTDSSGSKYTAHTNCVGNFFVTPDQWAPKFPILVRVAKGTAQRSMKTPIGRDTSCGACHVLVINDQNQFGSMPHIYLFGGGDPQGPSSTCPVNPDLGVPQ